MQQNCCSYCPVGVLHEPSTRIAINHTKAHLQCVLKIQSHRYGFHKIVASHVGDSVKICSKIYGGKYLEQTKGSPTFLNVGGNYPDAPLTLVIWNDVRKQFKYMPEDILKGKDVCIYGKIILYKNKPEIVISNPNQIQESIELSQE